MVLRRALGGEERGERIVLEGALGGESAKLKEAAAHVELVAPGVGEKDLFLFFFTNT